MSIGTVINRCEALGWGWFDEILCILDGLVDEWSSDMAGFFQQVLADVMAKLTNVIATIATLINAVISTLVKAISDIVDPIVEFISEALSSALTTLSTFTTDLLADFYSIITSTIADVGGFIDGITTTIYDSVTSLLESVSATTTALGHHIEDTLTAVVMSVSLLIDDINTALTETFEQIAQTITDVLTPIIDSFHELFELLTDETQNVFDGITDTIDRVIQDVVATVTTATEAIAGYATDLTKGVGELIQLLGEKIVPLFAEALVGFRKIAEVADTDKLEATTDASNEAFNLLFNQLAVDMSDYERVHETLQNQPGVRGIFYNIISTVISGLANVALLVASVNIANVARVEAMTQKVLYENPTRIMSINESVGLTSRGYIDYEKGQKEAQFAGYNPERFNDLLEGSHQPIDIERAVQAFFRGSIGEPALRGILERHGLNREDINTLIDVVPVRPPINDVISMAVRDVFSQDTVERFELFNDLPAEFVKEAKKNGLSEYWATRYWGAHWRLPSANQGFEMFHRSVISSADLDLLLRSLDMSPFWRDKLKAIAYRPVTRVDIRRMYKLGVIDVEEVHRRHLDLGYSPRDAELMTKFTVSLGKPELVGDDVDVRDLTKTQIEELVLLGTITQSQAEARLVDIGYSLDVSVLIVQSWLDNQAISDRKALINTAIQKALREDLTTIELEALLVDIQLTNEERARIDLLLSIERRQYDSIPAKSELKKMYESGIIDYNNWNNALRKHGYSDLWIERYAKLYGFQKET